MVCVPFRGTVGGGFRKERDATRRCARTDRDTINFFVPDFLWKLELAVVTRGNHTYPPRFRPAIGQIEGGNAKTMQRLKSGLRVMATWFGPSKRF